MLGRLALSAGDAKVVQAKAERVSTPGDPAERAADEAAEALELSVAVD